MAPTRPRNLPASRTAVPPAPLGRRVEVTGLADALHQAADGLGSARAVLGPSGIGKSALLSHVGALGLDQGFEVRRAFALEGWTAPFFLLDQLWPSSTPSKNVPLVTSLPLLAFGVGAPAEDPADRGGSEVAGGEEPILDRASVAPLATLGLSSSATHGAPRPEATAMLGFLRQLEESARRSAQLLLLDDLQWADQASVHGLRFLTRNAVHLPVLVVVAARWEGRPRASGAPLEAFLDELERTDRNALLRLGPLSPSYAHRLAESVLGGPLSTPVGSRPFQLLLERTGANPLLLAESLRAFQHDGFARADRGGWTLSIPPSWEGARDDPSSRPEGVPPALAKIVLSRMTGIPPGVQEALLTSALLGRRFALEPVAGALGLPVGELQRDLDPLTTPGGLLSQVAGAEPTFAFSHTMLWEALLASMPGNLRESRCRRLAGWYASHRPGEARTLARLYREAGDPAAGLHWVRTAMEPALAMQDVEGIERLDAWLGELLAAQGVGSVDATAERLENVQRLARSLGPHPVVQRLLTRLLASAPAGPTRWAVEERLAWVEAVRAPREGRARLERLSREVTTATAADVPRLLRGRLALTWANLLIREGKVPLAVERAQEAVPQLEGAGDPFDLARAHYTLGWCLAFMEHQEEARGALGRAMELAQKLDDARLLGLSLELKGMLANLRGALPEARAATTSALEQYRRAGSVNNVVITLGNLASVEVELGWLPSAWGRTEEMISLARRFDLPRGSALAATHQAAIFSLSGRPLEARARYLEAVEVYRGLGDRESLSSCLVKLARAEAATGEAPRALRTLEEVRRGEHGVLSPVDHYLVPWARATAKGALGDGAGARQSFEEARETAHAARNPYAEAEVAFAQAAWEARSGTKPEQVRALRSQAEELWKRCGVDPHELEEARRWTGPRVEMARPAPSTTARSMGPRSPSRRAGAPLAQRILLHLAAQPGPPAGAAERAPASLTQGGISRQLGLPQARFVKTLSRLVERGLVVAELRPVEGSGRRLKVYRTTPSGNALVAEWKR